MRAAALIAASLTLVPLCAAAAQKHQIPDGCPVTLPSEPRFTPPDAHRELANGFWHGSKRLAVFLNPHARLFAPKERQKMMWYREGYTWEDDRPTAPLRITGRRLDADSNSALYIEGPHNDSLGQGFSVMMHIIVMPEPGCWQIEGNYEGDYLSFVIWVE